MKKHFIIGIIISAIFLYLAFRNVDLDGMVSALQKANYWWLLPGIVFMFISLVIRAYRWHYFVKPIRDVKFKDLFSAMMIGYMANNVFPLRLGEVMRALAIGRSAKISRASAFATIIVERIIDILSLLIILGFTVFFHKFPPEIENAGLIIFFSAVTLVVFIVFLMEKTETTLRVVAWFISPLPLKAKKFVHKLLRSFLAGFEVFRHTHHYLAIILQSLALWILYAGIIFVTFFAFNIHLENDTIFIASLVILVMISIGIMIPSSPGFVGTYHYLAMQGLGLFGVSQTDALSFAIILHISNYIPMTLVGMYYFWKENLHFQDALQEKEEVEEDLESDQPKVVNEMEETES
ncbi:MAG: UPF0104 family protein [Calditrichaeota bacterium]|nr:MAG: UPF0104 family protein [Calditrichota bacterium]